jgi:hypothetical protein
VRKLRRRIVARVLDEHRAEQAGCKLGALGRATDLAALGARLRWYRALPMATAK